MRVVSFISSSLLLAVVVQAQLGPGRETGTDSDATATSDDALPPAPTESTGCVRADLISPEVLLQVILTNHCRLLTATTGIVLAEPTKLETNTTMKVTTMKTKRRPAAISSLTLLAKDVCSTAHTTTVHPVFLPLAQLSSATMI